MGVDAPSPAQYPQPMVDPAPDVSTDLPVDTAGALIGIGITGHRLARLDADTLGTVSDQAAHLLDAIADSLSPHDPATLRLVTALADGADSLVTDAAFARGWTVDAILPFARAEYADDFAESTRPAHETRLAASRAVLELPGSRNEDKGADYERAGRVVLAQSDVLIAIWDNAPARGRGGAGQIVAEAVLQGVPVIHIDATGVRPPTLLWDGLVEHSLGQQTVETVARGDITALPRLLKALTGTPSGQEDVAAIGAFAANAKLRWRWLSFAWPLLLAVTGVQRLRARRDPPTVPHLPKNEFEQRLATRVDPQFAQADASASAFAQRFRSAYVVNFTFAALAVVLSLLGLALPAAAKPALVILEVGVIAVILVLTRAGNRAGWHRRWLDNRHLAERLRGLSLASQLGDLGLRGDAERQRSWVAWSVRQAARALGCPDARIDTAYLARVRSRLLALIDDQVAYLNAEAHRMHRLEHRLHALGTFLFGATAAVCVFVLVFKFADEMVAPTLLHALGHPLLIAATIATAGFPAIGAAIYGIRMQGDFAGTAERSHALAAELATLRGVIADDALDFDTLTRRIRRASDLLTEDLASWLQTYKARPLTLPG